MPITIAATMAHQHQQPIARAQCVLRVRAGDLLQAEGSWTFSEPPTQIEGLQWRVAARVVNDCLEAKVCCDVGGNGEKWGKSKKLGQKIFFW